MSPLLTVAPMEGLTGAPFRRVHAQFFPEADRYYSPFVTPTQEPKFTERQLKEVAPEINQAIHAVPQLLTRRAEDFIWAAKALSDMGYDEVNLNLGCPAGTVVAKGKGAGFLREPAELEHFLNKIFTADLPIAISVKTRLGWSCESEFDLLSDVLSHFPIHTLIIHPRLRQDFYKGSVRREVLEQYRGVFHCPLGYNGDIVTLNDIKRESTQGFSQLMVGRGLIADPALFRKAKGGSALTRTEFSDYTQAIFNSYCDAFGNLKNALMRMKEYWFFWHNLFNGAEKDVKRIYKAKTLEDYQSACQQIFETYPMTSDAQFGWFKPL